MRCEAVKSTIHDECALENLNKNLNGVTWTNLHEILWTMKHK